MPEFDNPSFLRLGAGAALAFGSLLPEVLQLQFGALELALESPELFLGVPEMVPAMELAGDSVRGPVMALEFEPVKDLVKIPEIEPVLALGISQGIAQSNQLVQSSQPLASSSTIDRLTLLNIVLPAALVAPASLEKVLVSTTKALEQVLEQSLDLAPFADSFCGLKGMKTLPLAFLPFRAIDLWPALLNGEDDRRHGRRGLVKKTKGLREWCSDF
uniref:Uncharacterized protein n=1 Tax=Vitis vinifera TaxID=29760 RepID=A5BHD7_VITVI|nr:hypothetical protein VITISV_009868 [Vitis vinifera]